MRPGMSIPETVVQLTGLQTKMAALGKEENVAMQELLQFIGDDILVGHNLIFDYSFLKQWASIRKFHWNCRPVIPCGLRGHSFRGHSRLESLCEYFSD